jgi:hypothetical protein
MTSALGKIQRRSLRLALTTHANEVEREDQIARIIARALHLKAEAKRLREQAAELEAEVAELAAADSRPARRQ